LAHAEPPLSNKETSMKISFKPAIDNSEQLNLRISPTLKQRIENLRTHTRTRGLDYNATLLTYIEEFVTESEKQLGICYESASKTVASAPANDAESKLPPLDRVSTLNGADPDRA
jgi:hypothetical protein